MKEKYNAGLMSQSFWFVEFKKVVTLFDDGADYKEIKRQCIEENLFGAINPQREKRMCGYLITRLKSMDDKLIEIFINSDITNQKLINLIVILNTNRLFYEFVYEVYGNKLLIGSNSVDLIDANIFFSQKETQNEKLALWSDTTKKKLRSLFFTMLTEANLLRRGECNKSQRLVNRIFINLELEYYLKNNNPGLYKAITGEN